MNNPDTNPNGPRSAGATTFAVTALAFLALGCLMVAGRPGFLLEKELVGHGLAWVMVMIYGFGLSAVFGALYWAMPRTFGAPLVGSRMVFVHYFLHLAGMVAITVASAIPSLPFAWVGPALVGCGVLIFIIIMGTSCHRAGKKDVTVVFVSMACLWLAVMAVLGAPFAAKPVFPFLEGSNWSAGWLLLVIGGVLFNAIYGLALSVTTASTGVRNEHATGALFALGIFNVGMAWSFSGVAFAPPMFLVATSVVFLAGSLVFLGDFWGLLQRRSGRNLEWNLKFLLGAAWMIPAAVAVLVYNAVHRIGIDGLAAAASEATEGLQEAAAAAQITVASLNWATGLVALLAAAVPGLLAIIFQLEKLRADSRLETGAGGNVTDRVLLAAFFNYAVGVGLVVAGAWGAVGQMLGLGAIFLAVGAFGLLGYFIFNLRCHKGAGVVAG